MNLDFIKDLLGQWNLTITIFLPMAAAILLMFLPKQKVQLIRNFTLIICALNFIISLGLWKGFIIDTPDNPMQFLMRRSWIPAWGIDYSIGLDGISLLLVMLTTFLTPLVIWSTYQAIDKRVKEFMIFMLILETAMVGTFAALNLFLFYVFWELMLVPMYFLIGVWGGERRIYAAIKFFLFTMAGSVLMLLAILALLWLNKQQTGVFSFEYADFLKLHIPHVMQIILFICFGLAFAIKVPMFPFHTWLPDAHVEAPTAGSVILAGVLLKMGTYGLLRFCIPLFPRAVLTLLPALMILAVIGILYGAFVSMVQPDLKKLVAYSSVSHLGFVVLGMFAMTHLGIQGSVLQMVNHGLSTGALFLLVGVIYERRHTRLISEFGGLAKVMPIFGTIFMIVMLSSVGLPGLNGFIGEFLILVGTYTSGMHPWMKIFAALAASGVIFAAVYLLWMYQRVMFGPVKNPKNESLKDLSVRELLIFLPILLFIFWIGVYPKTFTKRLHWSVTYIVQRVEEVKATALTPGELLWEHMKDEAATGTDTHEGQTGETNEGMAVPADETGGADVAPAGDEGGSEPSPADVLPGSVGPDDVEPDVNDTGSDAPLPPEGYGGVNVEPSPGDDQPTDEDFPEGEEGQ